MHLANRNLVMVIDRENSEYLALLKEAESENTSGDCDPRRRHRLKRLAEPIYHPPSSFRPDIKTPPKPILADFAYCDRQAIRKAVICNPNTSIPTLLELGTHFPDELLNHCAFQPSDWNNLNFLKKLPWETVASLIQRPQISKSLLNYAMKYGFANLQKIAEMQVIISGEITEGWHEAAEKTIRKAPYEDDFTDGEHLVRLQTSFELLTNFSEFIPSRISNIPRFRDALDRNPNKKSTTYCGVSCDVVENTNTQIEILESLAGDLDYRVRKQVAENPNTPVNLLKTLANNSTEEVRECVSININCTFEIKETIFKNFAKSETPSFSRVALFMSDYAESSVLAENSNSISWLERYAIACNQKTPVDTLKQLAQDGNRIVRATAKESLEKTTSCL